MPRPTITKLDRLTTFEPPEVVYDEDAIAQRIALPVNPKNFFTLLNTNVLFALLAWDHRVSREYFHDLMITTFNFQNRLIRIQELSMLKEKMAAGEVDEDYLNKEIAGNMAAAQAQQTAVIHALKTFGHMRGPEDKVS